MAVQSAEDVGETVVHVANKSSFHTENAYISSRFREEAGCFFEILKKINMKRNFILAVLPLLAVSCANSSVEEKTAKFNDDIDSIVEAYREDISELQADTTLTQAQFKEAASEVAENAQEKLNKLCIKTIKKNRNNSLGVEALKNVYYELEADELEEIISSLGEENQEDEFVVGLKKGLAAKKTTAEGCMFVDFEVDGVKFSDYVGKGKYVLVDFWASWCGPCKAEIPNIADVYHKYAGEDFDVLSVAVWDKPEDSIAAASAHGVVWNQIINAQQVPTELYGIDGIPMIMLFAPDGTILKRDLRGEAIEEAVKQALGR